MSHMQANCIECNELITYYYKLNYYFPNITYVKAQRKLSNKGLVHNYQVHNKKYPKKDYFQYVCTLIKLYIISIVKDLIILPIKLLSIAFEWLSDIFAAIESKIEDWINSKT